MLSEVCEYGPEAMLLAFRATHRLPMACASDLLDLVENIAADPAALKGLKGMSRIAAAYKLEFGLAKYYQECLAAKLRVTNFSITLFHALELPQIAEKIPAAPPPHPRSARFAPTSGFSIADRFHP